MRASDSFYAKTYYCLTTHYAVIRARLVPGAPVIREGRQSSSYKLSESTVGEGEGNNGESEKCTRETGATDGKVRRLNGVA